MNFPYISHLRDIVPFIETNPQFRIQEQPNGTTVICYMLQDEDTFKGANEEYSKECRGITFDTATGRIISRTLHKFENVGQSDRSQPEQIPWNRIVRIMDKRDGSMITFIKVDGKIIAKTKKTFTSNEAIAATEFLHADPKRVEWVDQCLEMGFTPTFEWTSPRFPIVLTYEKDELTLLQLRHNASGEYVILSLANITFVDNLPFPLVENLISRIADPRQLLDAALTVEGVEGWIIQADFGEMWKIKTKWYVDLHHSVTFTRWRDVARTVLDDKADDLKAAFAMTGRQIDPIITVERVIHVKIEEVQLTVNAVVAVAREQDLTVKDLALKMKDHLLFGEIMRTFRGQEVKWNEWYLKNHIKDWGLDVIPTVTQNEDVELPVELSE